MKGLLIGHGYVGSYLAAALDPARIELTICDQDIARLHGVRNALHCPYQKLTVGDLADFDTILWFAGHSSVPKSVADPAGAADNNCFDLMALAQRKRADARLIYASTASVYSVAHVDPHSAPPTLDETQTRLNPVNPYDASKVAFDALATCFLQNVTGLRLGTVCGPSRFLRPELVFNAMNLSAMQKGKVRVSNAYAHRTLLFLEDLAFFVARLVECDAPLPGLLNAGSYNVNFGELAFMIASYYRVPVEAGEASPTYSFRSDWNRMRQLVGSPPEASIMQRCAEFEAANALAVAS